MKAQHFPGKEWRVGSEVPGGVELAGASLFSLGGTGGRLGSCGVAPFPRTMGFQSVPCDGCGKFHGSVSILFH
jgi:hypothetical protein